MGRSTKSANRIAYDKEVRRIQNAIKRLAKEGYVLPSDIIPQDPKRITKKRIQTLRDITPRVIRAESTRYDVETGEILKAPLGVRIKPKKHKIEKPSSSHPTPPTNDIPSNLIAPTPFDVFDRIQEYIEAIPSGIQCRLNSGKWDEYYWQNDVPLMKIFMEAMQTIDNTTLAEYYMANENRIVTLLLPPVYPSTEEEIYQGFTMASFYLNGGNALTKENAKLLGNFFGEL